MKACLYFFLLFLSSLSSAAQVVVVGRVTDHKNRPVAGASISLKDSYDGATSDSTGAFEFKTTEKGDHILTVTNIGYNAFSQNINLSSGRVSSECDTKRATE